MSPLIEELIRTSRDWTGDAPGGAMLTAMRDFMSGAVKDPALAGEAAAAIPNQPPGAAAWIALTLGTHVERGGSPKVSGAAVIAEMRAWLPRLPAIQPGTEPQLTAEQRVLLAQFQFLCQSVVTHLARLPAQREEMFGDAALRERLVELSAWSHGARWVLEALLKSSGTLVVLHPPTQTGLRVRYENVGHCFHLFSLLQSTVGTKIPGGHAPDELIAQVARGKSTDDVTDAAWWNYGTAASPAPEDPSAWDDRLVRDIPVVDGAQILLLWPPTTPTSSWTGSFLGPHLDAMPADAAIERALTPEEARAWLVKAGVLEAPKKWWRFW